MIRKVNMALLICFTWDRTLFVVATAGRRSVFMVGANQLGKRTRQAPQARQHQQDDPATFVIDRQRGKNDCRKNTDKHALALAWSGLLVLVTKGGCQLQRNRSSRPQPTQKINSHKIAVQPPEPKCRRVFRAAVCLRGQA
jgi:hypothetical protein